MSTQRVVVGVDGSPASFAALDVAAAEAGRRAGSLEVITCVGGLDEPGPVLRAAQERVAARHPGLTVRLWPAVGDPADVLVDRGRDACLVVVGSRGIGGVAALLMRSVSRRVAARTRAPLLVVRGTGPRDVARGRGTGPVLLGLESDGDLDAALFAFEEAELRGTGLEVLHAWTYREAVPPSPGVPAAEHVREHVGEAVHEPVHEAVARQASAAAELPRGFVAPLRRHFPHLAVETRSVRSTPCRALIAATSGAQLVVIAAHRRTHRPGIQLGPVTEALLHHAHCPVAVVPSPEP
ncbi:universal stress protein [Actinacidiphila alni]|uniref:universal stress protein n=1 Tax=Actinacidiphila alni TaxID=380248 RepID=UPI0033C47F8D